MVPVANVKNLSRVTTQQKPIHMNASFAKPHGVSLHSILKSHAPMREVPYVPTYYDQFCLIFKPTALFSKKQLCIFVLCELGIAPAYLGVNELGTFPRSPCIHTTGRSEKEFQILHPALRE